MLRSRRPLGSYGGAYTGFHSLLHHFYVLTLKPYIYPFDNRCRMNPHTEDNLMKQLRLVLTDEFE
jgi:hypothetical protein